MTIEFIEGIQIVYYTVFIVVFTYFLYAMIASRKEQRKITANMLEIQKEALKRWGLEDEN